MLNDYAIREKEEFWEEHGAHVTTPEGPILFESGAIDENAAGGMGRLIPPPTDPYELAQLVCRYWTIVAEQVTADFEEYKSYLSGSGQRKDAWKDLHDEESQLQFLRTLRTSAKRARAKRARATLAVNEAKPFWMDEREQAEIEEQARRHEFLQSVDDIKL